MKKIIAWSKCLSLLLSIALIVAAISLFMAGATPSRGSRVRHGTDPSPDREGTLYLNTSVGNGTLECYSNGQWRAVRDLP